MSATRRKLEEAKFFLRKLHAVDQQVIVREPETFEFYLSAFLSAARSVTFALQAERKEHYDSWFPKWKSALPAEESTLLTFFNNQRVAVVHSTGADVTYGSESISLSDYLSRAWQQSEDIEISNGVMGNPAPTFHRPRRSFEVGGTNYEVVPACTKYVELVAKLVQAFAVAFPE